ncbi:hypothetical protein [Natrinema ejinorense]|uniref:Uncharacterized protein n=1 Tax=Natrinema ejinorense TaxID=373386 RepID=A0A2A5QZI0_9EURY|nr:hypothetical protein [Natrinema ejinorense]PCR92236.1 hypothetical protein CP557_17885 [Natrinema ejinorense]
MIDSVVEGESEAVDRATRSRRRSPSDRPGRCRSTVLAVPTEPLGPFCRDPRRSGAVDGVSSRAGTDPDPSESVTVDGRYWRTVRRDPSAPAPEAIDPERAVRGRAAVARASDSAAVDDTTGGDIAFGIARSASSLPVGRPPRSARGLEGGDATVLDPERGSAIGRDAIETESEPTAEGALESDRSDGSSCVGDRVVPGRSRSVHDGRSLRVVGSVRRERDRPGSERRFRRRRSPLDSRPRLEAGNSDGRRIGFDPVVAVARVDSGDERSVAVLRTDSRVADSSAFGPDRSRRGAPWPTPRPVSGSGSPSRRGRDGASASIADEVSRPSAETE